MLCLCTGLITFGMRCLATGGRGNADGTVECVLVHLVVEYELELRCWRKSDHENLMLLLEGE